jgi:hypothetical protein
VPTDRTRRGDFISLQLYFRFLAAVLALIVLAAGMISCASNNPNLGRVLTSVSVTPEFADGQSSPDGTVFTATGTFSLPPINAPLTFAAPYGGQFVVDNPTGSTIATIIATGTGTVTVQCVSGATGSVFVSASAAANNDTPTVVSADAQLTCP